MLRELESLAEMFIKEARTWIAVNLFFMIVFPVAIIASFGYIVSRQDAYYLVSGTIVFQVALSGMLSVPNNIGMDRQGGRISIMIASGVPLWAYAMTSALVNNVFAVLSGLLIVGVAAALRYIAVSAVDVAYLTVALLLSTFEGSMVGLLIAARIRNWRLLQQVTQIASFTLTFFAPVYFPLSAVPRYLLPLAMLEPTTYAAQAIRLSLLGSPASLLWGLAALAYGAVFGAVAGRWGLA
ncbi:ATP-binding protein involved in mithramycin resistance [Acidilobus saccharovorans 345-15]|uniref:ATP-binding protein involved in mithramycin resistance n=1 Tax=Acidilobus saccharovorans (strain DSM 16705 / JCM 18335 / VKM B-2471 / 345-15) TaxID=666510 RepID=D9PZ31_ACIS3|nr:ABC transporter permease [Acidilobus saccharovorans]ADL19818.1 ATP-binding protein involved in mithramycin resistance [Acidilobus saccharovorans 345-15]